MINADYLSKAEDYAGRIPAVLNNRGLFPVYRRFFIADDGGGSPVWLFVEFDLSTIKRIETYLSKELIHHLSTSLDGSPVVVSNSSGLRYAVLLSSPPRLPVGSGFPGWEKGRFRIGAGKSGEVAVSWADLGNVLVAGMTRSGKSNFLRLLAYQAISEGFEIMIVDPDGSTFPALYGNPDIVYGGSLDAADEIVEVARRLLIKRTSEANAAKLAGIDPPVFTRAFLIVDEYSGLIQSSGGAKGSLSQSITSVVWGGLKFGIHVVLAGHEFTREIVGPVASQMITRFCFRVRAPSVSKIVAGKFGAERIKETGRALSDPFGWIQVYKLDVDEIERAAAEKSPDGLSDRERGIVETIRQKYSGRVTFDALSTLGFSRSQAEKLRRDWETRGIARRSRADDNALILV